MAKYVQQAFDNSAMPNGLRVIGERMPSYRSVSVGMWVRCGSVGESPEENGFSHFIEHMLFKGTESRSARRIAEEMDAIGGQMNAFTAKECTCFYVKVLGEHIERAMDLLADLLLNSKLDAQEMEKERGVILEEIAMVEDTPEDLAHEMLSAAHFGGHPLAMPILGPQGNIEAVSRDTLNAYRRARYTPGNTVLSVAGDFEWARVVDLANTYLSHWTGDERAAAGAPDDACVREAARRRKDIEQTHLCIGYPGVRQDSDDVYPMMVLNNILGGGMSSRLFQRIREERGLAYTVYSYPASYQTCGLFTIYAGTGVKNAPEVIKLVADELGALLSNGVTEEEFVMGRDQLKGGFLLGQESTTARMSAIGRARLLLKRVLTEEEVLTKINAVTADDVMRVARGVFSQPHSAAIVGREPDVDLTPLDGVTGL